MTTGVARNTGWSWSALVAEYGEDGALARLPYMPGLGSVGNEKPAAMADNAPCGPTQQDEVHDEAPVVGMGTLDVVLQLDDEGIRYAMPWWENPETSMVRAK